MDSKGDIIEESSYANTVAGASEFTVHARTEYGQCRAKSRIFCGSGRILSADNA